MLDHVFLDAVGTLGAALSDSLLERNRQEDRLATDLLLGDIVWETSVSLPGDGDPSRVRADLTLDWPTWSQSSWRSWVLGEPIEEPPEIGLEVVFRLQRLAARPAIDLVLEALGEVEPPGLDHFERAAIVAEEDLGTGEMALDVAYEGTYRLTDPADAPRRGLFGSGPLPDLGGTGGIPDLGASGDHPGRSERPPGGPYSESSAMPLTSPGAGSRGALSPTMTTNLTALGRWIASALVRLADLDLETLPDPEDD
jgi:hypothetical protein